MQKTFNSDKSNYFLNNERQRIAIVSLRHANPYRNISADSSISNKLHEALSHTSHILVC